MTFLQFLKRIIKEIPSRIGTGLVLQKVNLATMFLVNHPHRIARSQRKVASDEARRIGDAISIGGVREAVIVYDYLVSPATYGDFIYVVLVARFFLTHRIPVRLCIINSDYGPKWDNVNSIQKKKRTTDHLSIASALLNCASAKVEEWQWDDLFAQISSKAVDRRLIPLHDLILKRERIYNHCFNMLNHLLEPMDVSFRDRFLLSPADLVGYAPKRLLKSPYVALLVRYNSDRNPKRNVSPEEFITTFYKLRHMFPKHEILVISDPDYCFLLKEIASEEKIGCFFSSDFTVGFLGDAFLALKSDFTINIRSGLGVCLLFSSNPYIYYASMVHEIMWNRQDATSWQTTKQHYINSNELDFT